nr:unnamed protein product [Digitaria exilis]CAB3469908.1 unnamed protein product [Digitaria exilis]
MPRAISLLMFLLTFSYLAADPTLFRTVSRGFYLGRMILAHLCDEPRGLKSGMFMSLVFLCFPVANALIAKINDGAPLVDEPVLLLLYCVYAGELMGLYLYLAVSVVHEIKDALGIYCFRITRKEA